MTWLLGQSTIRRKAIDPRLDESLKRSQDGPCYSKEGVHCRNQGSDYDVTGFFRAIVDGSTGKRGGKCHRETVDSSPLSRGQKVTRVGPMSPFPDNWEVSSECPLRKNRPRPNPTISGSQPSPGPSVSH